MRQEFRLPRIAWQVGEKSILKKVFFTFLILLLAYFVGKASTSLSSLDPVTILKSFTPAVLVGLILLTVLVFKPVKIGTARDFFLSLKTVPAAVLILSVLVTLAIGGIIPLLLRILGGFNFFKALLLLFTFIFSCWGIVYAKRSESILAFVLIWPILFNLQNFINHGAEGAIPNTMEKGIILFSLLNLPAIYVGGMAFIIFLVWQISQREKSGLGAIDTVLLFFLLWTALSIVFSNNHLASLNYYLDQLFAPALFFFVIRFTLNDSREVKTILQITYAVCVIIIIQAIPTLLELNRYYDAGLSMVDPKSVPLVYLFISPNYMSVVLLQIIPIGIMLLVLLWDCYWKRYMLIGSVVLLVIVVFSLRSLDTLLWGSLSTLMVVLLWLKVKRRLRAVGFFTVIAASIIMWWALSNYIFTQATEELRYIYKAYAPLSGRWEAIKLDFQIALNNPLMGTGLGITEGLELVVYAGGQWFFGMAGHNQFIGIARSAGFLAGASLLAIYLIIFRRGLVLLKRKADNESLIILFGLIWALIGAFLNAQTETFVFTWNRISLTGLLFWMNAGLLYVMGGGTDLERKV